MVKKSTLKCSKCGIEPIPMHLEFSYLDRVFHEDVLRCPKCGQVYLPESFTSGMLSQVETRIEDDYRTLNN